MYGLVLEGGGAKGAYHIGACKAMNEMGLSIGGVAGTSVGALNGAMIVQGDLEKAYEMWYNMSPSMVINFHDDEMGGLPDEDSIVGEFNLKIRRLKKIILEKGLDVEPLIRTVSGVVDEEKIRKSAVEFGIVTVDLTDRKPLEIYKEEIPEGKLVDYIIASASFPGFKLREIDGRVFIDGGVYNALPLNLIIDKKFTDIIVIRTFGMGRKKKVDTAGLNIIQIAPCESLGPVLDFSNTRARKTLLLGYYDAVKVFNKLKGRRFYVKPLNDDHFFIHCLVELKEDRVDKIASMFGIEEYKGKRVLFEYIVPKIADLLGIPRSASYEDICIALIEYVAEASGIERFKVYSLKELFAEISLRYKPEKDEFKREIPGFLRKIDPLSKMVRDRIISSVASELFEEIRSGNRTG